MDNNRMDDAKRIVEEMEKKSELSKIEELIKDNKISFEYEDKKYRVRLLNLKEKEELDMLRRKKFGQLLKDKDILLEKDLITQYKDRGINVDELDEQYKKLHAEEMNLQITLGDLIAKNEPLSILKINEDQIKEIRNKKQILMIQKNLLLTYCLENQLLAYVAQVITYLSLEELKENSWVKAFNSLDEFQTYNDEKLIEIAASYSMVLQYL